MSYQALSLKYRPRRFEDLIGQDSVSQTLSLALSNNRLGHAYLFSGLRGSGKTSTARIFAKALTCDNAPTATPCEVCESCKMANEGRHIDIIEMDAASNRKIDDIRDLIEHTRYKPTIAQYKVFIIDEVHMLTKEAFNALLKTLEEPPSYIKFILATTDPLKVPPTILSRTQHFRFKKIGKNLVIAHLEAILNKEGIDFQPSALDLLARSGNGSLRDTLTLLDQAIIYSKGYVETDALVSMLGLLNPQTIDEMMSAVMRKDRREVLTLLEAIDDFDADVIIEETVNFLVEDIHNSKPRFPLFLTERFLQVSAQTKNLLAMGADPFFAITLMFLKMIEATHIDDIDDAIEKLEQELQNRPLEMATMAKTEVTSSSSSVLSSPIHEVIKEPYTVLLEKLYAHNDELGGCFSSHMKFIAFENKTLSLERCMEGSSVRCKELFKLSSAFIRQTIQECYGMETELAFLPCTQSEQPSYSSEKKLQPSMPEPEPKSEELTSSMVEESEMGGSCVSGCALAPVEINPATLMEEPSVQKAIELFDPKKVKIIAHL